MNVHWTEAALSDLHAVADYISRHSSRYADSVVRRIIDRSESLSQHPLVGAVVPEYETESLREGFGDSVPDHLPGITRADRHCRDCPCCSQNAAQGALSRGSMSWTIKPTRIHSGLRCIAENLVDVSRAVNQPNDLDGILAAIEHHIIVAKREAAHPATILFAQYPALGKT